MRKLAVAVFASGLLLLAAPAVADVVEIASSKDNTLYQHPDGALSNGSGTRMFVGMTAQQQEDLRRRRALVAFDIASNVPPGATITAATLTLEQVMTIAGPTTVSLHLATEDWGEGDSIAPGQQGAGGPAAPGDATWLHTFYDTEFWIYPGGDFFAPSASTVVEGFGSYSWSSPGMVDDVQLWLDNPAGNFGWVLLGDESGGISAKTFSTREADSNPPVLTIEFEPEDGSGVPAVSTVGALALALAMLTLATVALRRRAALDNR